ncbi:carbamoyltransferase HypF [Aestuariirhabdus litorea]|uniref:Carbamoyltransferase HypF n=1 Tax=Aestuariirhabdus litorea TaxID=2528527 RepID=A0A3P3VRM2_9GAMM|nr:carbamoyltransferase HypF [Aestuariirhabdus litorea]RWW98618.1 carbamoyltransferase HypF [Endozoicomonadaceae bacterium GTF-13]
MHLSVLGLVQGVGFRPFVYGLAQRLGLDGWVANDGEGVQIELEGELPNLQRFQQLLHQELPPLALIDRCEVVERPLQPERGFRIVQSRATEANTSVAADAAVCPDCLNELFDPANRRYRYPFINCTNCGPRYTITRRLPYDRPYTSMAEFQLCGGCQQEYDNPSDRRFHAQPNACARCGPELTLVDSAGETVEGDPIESTLRALRRGDILAIKGIGGFHLVCDADNSAAVERLRKRKARDAKPFAVMVANRASLESLVELDEASARRLESSAAPIMLLPRRQRDSTRLLAEGLAPGLDSLGVMLPYSPLHQLIFFEAAGRPTDAGWRSEPQSLRLVMTSANPAGEPLVIDNAEALAQLAGFVDGLLLHNRAIDCRCDDSVVQAGTPPMVVRRGRGLAPQILPLIPEGPPLLALGGWFKNSICLAKQQRAYVSPHIGDLNNANTCRFLEQSVEHMRRLFAVTPEAVACDLHPDFFSTRLAQQLAEQWRVPLVAVQHHHAHIAAVMSEHRLSGPVLGLALDGIGLGEDGSAWGGELLLLEGAGYQRLGQLRSLPLPGGDRAAREPWRIAAALLHLLGRNQEIESRLPYPGSPVVAQMLRQGLNCPPTSSAGRWFDGVAALLGVCAYNQFEARAAMSLESLAAGRCDFQGAHLPALENGQLDLLPLVSALVDEADPVRGAQRFHGALVIALEQWVMEAVQATGLERVALGGGCFLNRLLRETLCQRLRQNGVKVYLGEQLPCNDAGLSLGQAWVARQRLAR